eukprot:CAMPEP_0194126262 /NCGR_PEP_ID=MMETSP0150-20130528/59896_1 /TAXON_ID=122233 /ORGANISM="Chaetoceros debilis, Strain MM31A-1" /LENGTH=63 /DNA_ID=CAMNT_0038820113 /DNA_START=718 /DNA_END=909 /DNA_ORIENTATION=-
MNIIIPTPTDGPNVKFDGIDIGSMDMDDMDMDRYIMMMYLRILGGSQVKSSNTCTIQWGSFSY